MVEMVWIVSPNYKITVCMYSENTWYQNYCCQNILSPKADVIWGFCPGYSLIIQNVFLFLQSIDHFEDLGPSVVMASPGMMQSGLSRELFEDWCIDKRNGTIIAGYCVEGTLAKVSCWSKQSELMPKANTCIMWHYLHKNHTVEVIINGDVWVW